MLRPAPPRILATTLVAVVFVAGLSGCGEGTPPPAAPPAPPPPPIENTDPPANVRDVPPPTAESDRDWTLDEPTRAYLWDMEHHANVLGRYGFGAVKGALVAEDRDALSALLSPDLTGTMPDGNEGIRIDDTVFQGRLRSADDGAVRTLDAAALVTYLMTARGRFHEPPQIGFGVKRISPEDRDDLDAPWWVLCEMQMRGETAEGAPADISCILDLRIARPTKERMQEPGWLLSCSIIEEAVNTATHALFEAADERLGFDTTRLHDNWDEDERWNVTGGVYACDFDRDGCTDLLVTDVSADGTVFLRGLPTGDFEDATEAVGLTPLQQPRLELEAAFADLDGDGWEDLVIANGQIWRNLEGKRFEDVSESSNLRRLLRKPVPSGLSIADVDRDGRVDLYVARSGGLPTSWLHDTKDNPHRNLLLMNRGDWMFEDATAQVGGDGGARSVFNAVWFDANGDGWPDVYVINEFGDGALYVNEQGADAKSRRLREVDIDPDTADFGAMGAACGDIDDDGDVDLYVASMYSKAGNRVIGNMPEDVYPDRIMRRLWRLISGSELYCNNGDLAFSACGETARVHDVGWAWGTSLADFDNDGRLDIFATAGYMSRDRGKPDG